MHPTKFGFSQGLTRKEDDALIRGNGRYVADIAPDGTLHAVVLRSPHAHAHFRVAGVTAARAMKGVHLVLTGPDVTDLGNLPCVAIPEGLTVNAPPYPILAWDEVRHVGDAVAFVVADTVEHANDAAEAIVIDWQPLPHVVSAVDALKPGAPPVWPSHAGNIAFEQTLGDEQSTTQAVASATRTVSLSVINQRLVTNYLDTRAVIAEYDEQADRLTLTLGSQGSHLLRDLLSQMVLRIAPDKLRVVTPDVGGGFGTKLFPYREYALAAVAAKQLKRPVKWVAERAEHFLGDTQGRDNFTTATLALDADHRFTALSIDTICDMGAYLSAFAPYIPYVGAAMLPGAYDFPTCFIRITAAFTNTLPVDAYRGAGRPEAAYLIERLVDTAAHDIGISPDALRRRNFIKPKAMPYTTPTHKVYDSGDFAGHMARAQEIIDWKGFGKRAATSKKAGKLRGIGLATYIEACGNNGPDAATVRLERDGNITVLAGSQSTGQGHNTAYAQLVAEHLDLPPERVTVIQGDTDLVATGAGTGGSSSITCGGASVESATRKLAVNLKSLAAYELEAAETDLEIENGHVRIAGTDRTIPFAQLAASIRAKPELLSVTDSVGPPQPTYPNGTHLAEVEVDPDTGHIDILSYVVVDDFGVTLNPLLLAGQVQGGAAQGIGQATMENTVYDASSGQLVTASLMDYALPRASDVPPFTFETRNVRCATNPLGVKGAGEAGAIGSAPAVMNAVMDALHRAYRIRHVDMPATPERIWAALREGRRMHAL
ncbi:MAG TPA: xanthine dehydrogenase family protein molybdopterin-binding subunit [Xanthobacteraceae bacterium]|nr:xanthine dehydrogenase family protein molybdopterin-binding subunit [Xanthobacteraceae bacterium]